jgi:DNA-binding NarL/FixJ family response regulator
MEEWTKSSIIVAEEFRLVREGLARLCESSGRFQVVDQCCDGAAALQAIQLQRPDVAVIDLNLPRLFSLEIVRKIREQQLNTKVIIVSVRGDRKLVLESLRSGANGFVLKSCCTQNLLDAIDQVIAGGVYVAPELQLEKIFITPRRNEPEDPLETLSSREYQVFSLLIDGVRAKEIAARLDLSPKTVDTYRAGLMRKLDIHDLAGLVKFAIQRDLTSVA